MNDTERARAVTPAERGAAQPDVERAKAEYGGDHAHHD